MKKIVFAAIVCAAVSSCSFMGISGSSVPAGTYRAITDPDGDHVVTTVELADGSFKYQRAIDGDVQVRYEATFDSLTDIGINTYEAVLTSLTGLAGSTDWTSLNTSVAQLQLIYNSPTLRVNLDVNGNGAFDAGLVDLVEVSFEAE